MKRLIHTFPAALLLVLCANLCTADEEPRFDVAVVGAPPGHSS